MRWSDYGFLDPSGSLRSIGIQCSLCHSTVDNSAAPGIGRRLDGWANRDLNVGAIIASAPNLAPFSELLGVNVATVRKVLLSWGPGKFDAELALDGKGFRPDGSSAAVLSHQLSALPGLIYIPGPDGGRSHTGMRLSQRWRCTEKAGSSILVWTTPVNFR